MAGCTRVLKDNNAITSCNTYGKIAKKYQQLLEVLDFKECENVIFDDLDLREDNALGQCVSDNFSSSQRKLQITVNLSM